MVKHAQARARSATKRQWQLPVLKTRPWPDLTWPEMSDAIERHSSTSSPETHQWLATLQDWAAGLQATFPTLLATACRIADELPPDRLRQHAAVKILFQARNARLDQEVLARHCPTPRRTIDLATALGLTLDELPD